MLEALAIAAMIAISAGTTSALVQKDAATTAASPKSPVVAQTTSPAQLASQPSTRSDPSREMVTH